MFTATLHVAPRGKQRPRFGRGRTFTPPETVAAEAEIRWLLRKLAPPRLLGAVAVTIRAYLKRPKSAPKSRVHPVVGQDVDNVGKLVLDAANGILWDDDRQVCRLQISKHYGDPERIELEVSSFE